MQRFEDATARMDAQCPLGSGALAGTTYPLDRQFTAEKLGFEHAKIWFKLLMENGEIPDTLTCLKMAAAGENEEHTSMYPRMAAEAKAEGFTQIAALFTMVAAIEKDHEERYKALTANIEAGKVYARETEQVWQCRNCGFVYIGQHAPVKCPVCAHPQSYFELKSSNY